MKLIYFPKEEVTSSFKAQNQIVTTRVSSDYNKYFKGDIVYSTWKVKYIIYRRENYKRIIDHPYYQYLTEEQKDIISLYPMYCVLWLKRIISS